ncbi:MAG: hypothetical protein FWD15_02635 [Alphaproteobacteria bacterium]|nr:hypothetical protein [Alphaproteobacteria bacterium]
MSKQEEKMGPYYNSAFPGLGNNVMYRRADGNIYESSEGTRAWRNNNPGNLRDYSFARNQGAIGRAGGETDEAPAFAIFPDMETGWDAMVNLLSGSTYQKLTI